MGISEVGWLKRIIRFRLCHARSEHLITQDKHVRRPSKDTGMILQLTWNKERQEVLNFPSGDSVSVRKLFPVHWHIFFYSWRKLENLLVRPWRKVSCLLTWLLEITWMWVDTGLWGNQAWGQSQMWLCTGWYCPSLPWAGLSPQMQACPHKCRPYSCWPLHSRSRPAENFPFPLNCNRCLVLAWGNAVLFKRTILSIDIWDPGGTHPRAQKPVSTSVPVPLLSSSGDKAWNWSVDWPQHSNSGQI